MGASGQATEDTLHQLKAESRVIGSSIISGKKVVVTAGTRVSLGESTEIKGLIVTGLITNGSRVVVGGNTVDVVEGIGIPIFVGGKDTYILDIDDLSKVYLDGRNAGDGVTFTYIAR